MKRIGLFIALTIIFSLNSISQTSFDGLVLHYPFINNTVDISGNDNRGLNHGATLTTDRFNRDFHSYEFDGIFDYIEFNTDSLLQPYFTYSLWAYPYSMPSYGAQRVLLSIGNSSSAADHGISLGNNYSNGQMTGWTVWSYATTGTGNPVDQDVLPADSSWYHVVLVRDTTDIKLYIDGELFRNRII